MTFNWDRITSDHGTVALDEPDTASRITPGHIYQISTNSKEEN